MNRKFLRAFQFYIPTDEELREAHVHSKRADTVGNKLEKRFGHPALHAELFTPMVHASMTHLLSEVYSGKIGDVKTKLDDLGGNKVDARVVAGGIKIAGIDQVGDEVLLSSSVALNIIYFLYSAIWSMTLLFINAIAGNLTGTNVQCRQRTILVVTTTLAVVHHPRPRSLQDMINISPMALRRRLR